MHPVILRLIAIKWQLFGKMHAARNTAINLFYTILWTVLGVSVPKGNIMSMYSTQKLNLNSTNSSPTVFTRELYYKPLAENSWRIVLEIIAIAMTIIFTAVVSILFNRDVLSKRTFSFMNAINLSVASFECCLSFDMKIVMRNQRHHHIFHSQDNLADQVSGITIDKGLVIFNPAVRRWSRGEGGQTRTCARGLK